MVEAGPLLAADGLRVKAGRREICQDLSLRVRGGEAWALLGPNGAGKTSLLHTLAGLRPAATGAVACLGRPLAEWRRRALARHLGVLFQQSEAGFPVQVLETVLTGRHPHLGRWGWERPEDLAAAHAALAAVGLEGLDHRTLQTLSGGERRRVEIATLLAQDPRCALLDEPGHHLDLGQEISVLRLLRTRFTRADRAMLVVMHDPGLALRFSSHLLLLYGDGRWAVGTAAQLGDADTLSELYGHPLNRIEGPHGPVFAPT
jgi:iron complex transport system ATP-binding protein